MQANADAGHGSNVVSIFKQPEDSQWTPEQLTAIQGFYINMGRRVFYQMASRRQCQLLAAACRRRGEDFLRLNYPDESRQCLRDAHYWEDCSNQQFRPIFHEYEVAPSRF